MRTDQNICVSSVLIYYRPTVTAVTTVAQDQWQHQMIFTLEAFDCSVIYDGHAEGRLGNPTYADSKQWYTCTRPAAEAQRYTPAPAAAANASQVFEWGTWTTYWPLYWLPINWRAQFCSHSRVSTTLLWLLCWELIPQVVSPRRQFDILMEVVILWVYLLQLVYSPIRTVEFNPWPGFPSGIKLQKPIDCNRATSLPSRLEEKKPSPSISQKIMQYPRHLSLYSLDLLNKVYIIDRTRPPGRWIIF